MLKKCHGIDIELDSYIKNNSNFILCYIRKQEFLLTPEEEVRQAILKVIHEHLDIDFDSFICRVESQSLDISFYHKYPNASFQPSLNPFLIIEIKRDDIGNLLQSRFETQLLGYLERHYCSFGLLANCHRIYLFDEFKEYKPTSIGLSEVAKIFDNARPELTDDITDFENAKSGDIDSFKRLALKFGRNSTVTFAYKDSSAPINAFLIDFQQDYMLFYLRGFRGGRKPFRIRLDSFIKLISITE